MKKTVLLVALFAAQIASASCPDTSVDCNDGTHFGNIAQEGHGLFNTNCSPMGGQTPAGKAPDRMESAIAECKAKHGGVKGTPQTGTFIGGIGGISNTLHSVWNEQQGNIKSAQEIANAIKTAASAA